MRNLVKFGAAYLGKFKKDEDGLALTEYLILLGLLTAAVIAAVILFGGNIATSYDDWAAWIGANTGAPS